MSNMSEKQFPERVSKLGAVFSNFKEALSSLNRGHPLVFFHPPRLPNALDIEGLVRLAAMTGQGVEFDIRSTATGQTVQQGMFTDRLKGWASISDFSSLEKIIGEGRVAYLKEVASGRLKEGEELSFDLFKGKLWARDLTQREFETITNIGNEEVLGVDGFFNVYQNLTSETLYGHAPARLAIDLKDSDMTLGGTVEFALGGLVATMEQVNVRLRAPNVNLAFWYDVGSFEKTRALLQGTGITSAMALSSDLLKKKGPQAFAELARGAVGKGANYFGLKLAELDIIADVLNSDARANIYVPPAESQKPEVIIEALRKYPTIASVQLDV